MFKSVVDILNALLADVTKSKTLHPDVGINVIDLIRKYDYPVEIHEDVETDDGYLLQLHRIPHGKNNASSKNKPVVLLMHGLLGSSASYVSMGPNNSLAYLLADLGYDVWMGNARGNTWSKKHKSLNASNPKFWKFSWHEIGVYDLTAKIDYILKETGQEKLFYIGHSQGTTAFYVMASERPEYNKKIRLMVSLAPVAYMSNMTNKILQLLSQHIDVLEIMALLIGMNEFLPSNQLMHLLARTCIDNPNYVEFYSNIYYLLFGLNAASIDECMLPVILTHAPAGSSSRQLIHYGQGIRSARFRKYDHGLENMAYYGSSVPPDYDIDRINAPIALFYGESDDLAAVEDVQKLSRELPNVVVDHLLPNSNFNHMDFLFGNNVKEQLYQRVFKLMEDH